MGLGMLILTSVISQRVSLSVVVKGLYAATRLGKIKPAKSRKEYMINRKEKEGFVVDC